MLGSDGKEEENIVSAPQINHIILGNLEILNYNGLKYKARIDMFKEHMLQRKPWKSKG